MEHHDLGQTKEYGNQYSQGVKPTIVGFEKEHHAQQRQEEADTDKDCNRGKVAVEVHDVEIIAIDEAVIFFEEEQIEQHERHKMALGAGKPVGKT